MKVAILGVGLIGGSIGLAARERGATVAGFGRDAARLERARELGAIDVAASSLEKALAGADACFACAPVGALADQVTAALRAAADDCVVSDVGSTKAALMAVVDDPRFVGGHPIAGAETAGVEHARADLFEGAVWYLTPHASSEGLLYERLHRFVRDLGARPVPVEPQTHDRLVAVFSHVPHVLANVLAAQGAERLLGKGEGLRNVGPSFRDATRVAGANTAMWADIYRANADAIVEELEAYRERLDAAIELLRTGEGIESWNDEARAAQRALLEAEFPGGTIHELRIIVPNRPGIVAQVALALGTAGVNIVDMALAPAPDMRSGSMTLWIAGDAEARRADALLAELDL